jgi:amidophosphoribosyltransferase
MDFPSRGELIANRCDSNVESIRQELGVDSLAYLSMENMLEAAPKTGYCTACFSGSYPVALDRETAKDANDA